MSNSNLVKTIKTNNDYYIHLNARNIGNKASSAIINFATIRNQVIKNTQAQYYEKFNSSLKGSSVEILAQAMDKNLTEDRFLNLVNKQLAEKLQKDINIGALRSLYTITHNKGMSNFLKNAINKQSIDDLSKALQIIADALTLLEKSSEGLGAVLSDFLSNYQGEKTFVSFGKALGEEVRAYSVKNNYRLIKRQSLESAKTQLNNLSVALSSGQFVSGKNLSADGLSTLLLNGIVSTSIAEGLGFAASGKAQQILNRTIIQAVGTNSVTSDINPNITIPSGKTDVKAKNVSVTISNEEKQNEISFKLDIGISSKFYTSQGFKDIGNREITISSGSGGSLKDALNMIFSGDIQKYLVYNYIVHDQHLEEIHDLLIKRQILRLFATVGVNDFSQFMLINGHIVSTWDIMNYALNTSLPNSRSQGIGTQGLAISISGRQNIKQENTYNRLDEPHETPLIAAWSRSHRVNSAFSSATIKAELHFKKLMDGMRKKI